MKLITSLLITSCLALPALAQDKAPAATAPAAAATPAPAADPAMPKHSCAQPVAPGRLSTEAQEKKFRADVDAYRNCLVDFNKQMQAEAGARIKAANAAVEEYNGYIKRVNEKSEQDDKDAATAVKATSEAQKIPKT